ncbi:transporter substrate-binding domain-containing protein [Streptomyces sp. NPDC056149]|uniref:transporter substrate-binding domain-containing protein n=1 Tax=unclassified Streptomyces TaxID=2593676 RepID=UPI0023814988|nr:transporter substrate-binding domain-containing protein [Streptomyces sp. WZ-12]
MHFRTTGIAAALALTALTATACSSSEPASLFASGKVLVGVKSDQPGTGYFPDGYNPSGFDITLARHILKTVGAEPDFSAVPSEDRLTVLTGKKKDLIIATFSITPDRMKQLDFAGPYANTRQGIMVRKNDHRITKPSDVIGKRVCAWPGTTSYNTLNGPEGAGMKVYQSQTAQGCITDLLNKTADAVSTDQMILYGFTQEHRDLKVIPNITYGPFNQYGIAMDKGHHADCVKIRDALKDYVSGSSWSQDFSTTLPSIPHADPDWEGHYKPRTANIDALSCRAKPAF